MNGELIMTKSLGKIRNLKTFIHKVIYIATFIVMQSNVVGSIYFMSFGCP